ncbi:hypothetical protein [Streptomyces sp. NBC_01353]|uniref:hypothetical protein n=1 Tax=Streptomyces sp. NBC_01353 TaxID=2903835 RepID=UPI002E371274|nr:hypothetical protein [Streptomyces sp. NBC_01353]
MRDDGVISEVRAGLAGRARQSRPAGTVAGNPLRWLAGVSVALTLAHLALIAPGLGLGWDETVYVSQVSGETPAAFFSAPRARGITYLVAPLTALTPSITALRVYMAVLAGCGLFLALWVWRRLLPAPVLGFAGGLFAGLWVTMFYASQAMPNLWVAYGALAAVGCFLRAVRDPNDRWAPAGMAAGVAFAALMRPTDAVWLTVPLAVAALAMRPRRWWLLMVALGAGLAVGCAEWIAEAYVSYGGLAERLDRASEIQGRLGWYFSVDDHVRALGGRLLCRPCDVPWRYPVATLWFIALPLLVTAGVRAAVRARHHRTELVGATVVGTALAAPYLFTVGYAAPRFLLPAYALLALPVAYGLVRACRPRPRGRRIVVGLLVLAVTAHLAIQYGMADSTADRVRRDTADLGRVTAELNALGVRPPCVVSGVEAIRVAFRAGCASRQPDGHDESITPEQLAATALHQPVAIVVWGGGRPPSYAASWPAHPLPDLGNWTGLRAYVSGVRPPEAGR